MLDGLRIIEFEGLGPAPFAAMLLAELGAEVIVIHRPEGASLAAFPNPNPLDRGKRSIVLDLKSETGRTDADALVARADGLIEGFRPGVMERLGLGPETCHARNPRLIYGRMTGWGQSGPRAQLAGHDLNYVATSGALWYASPPGIPPMTPPTLVGDIGGGALYLAVGMLAGLIAAARTGQGCVVDAAIVDGSAHMMALISAMRSGGAFRDARGQSLLDGPYWSRSYACSCGGHVAVQCLEPRFHAVFLDRLGLTDDPRFARQLDPDGWPDASARLETIFAAQSRDDWAALFAGSDACVAPVLSPSDAAVDPHMVARGIWHDGMPAPAPRFSQASPRLRPAPRRNADAAVIRAELNLP